MIRHLVTLTFIPLFFFISTNCFAMSFWPFNWFKADPCLNQGNTHWDGTGKATGAVQCDYAGDGMVLGNAPDYQLKVHLGKTNGSFLCPGAQDLVLNFSCINGKITVRQPNIQLDGQIANKTITMEGTISIAGIKDHVVLTANRKD